MFRVCVGSSGTQSSVSSLCWKRWDSVYCFESVLEEVGLSLVFQSVLEEVGLSLVFRVCVGSGGTQSSVSSLCWKWWDSV